MDPILSTIITSPQATQVVSQATMGSVVGVKRNSVIELAAERMQKRRLRKGKPPLPSPTPSCGRVVASFAEDAKGVIGTGDVAQAEKGTLKGEAVKTEGKSGLLSNPEGGLHAYGELKGIDTAAGDFSNYEWKDYMKVGNRVALEQTRILLSLGDFLSGAEAMETRLKGECSSLRKKVCKLEAELAAMKVENVEHVSRLEDELSALRRQRLEGLNEKITKLQENSAAKDRLVTTLENDWGYFSGQVGTLETQIKEYTQNSAELVQDKEKLEKEVSVLRIEDVAIKETCDLSQKECNSLKAKKAIWVASHPKELRKAKEEGMDEASAQTARDLPCLLNSTYADG